MRARNYSHSVGAPKWTTQRESMEMQKLQFLTPQEPEFEILIKVE
jgi:hypothetical protein